MDLFRWIPAALLLVGCQTPDHPLPYPLTITQEGLGPIRLGETFDKALIQGKFPGFEIDALSEVRAEQRGSILRLKRNDETIALIVSDPAGEKLTEVIVLSPHVKNAQGMGINDPLPLSDSLHCTNDQCRYENEPSLTYRIDPQTHTILEIAIQRL